MPWVLASIGILAVKGMLRLQAFLARGIALYLPYTYQKFAVLWLPQVGGDQEKSSEERWLQHRCSYAYSSTSAGGGRVERRTQANVGSSSAFPS